jgi:hypothetical protein
MLQYVAVREVIVIESWNIVIYVYMCHHQHLFLMYQFPKCRQAECSATAKPVLTRCGTQWPATVWGATKHYHR